MLSQDTTDKLLKQLYIDEGYRQFAYDDATGLAVKAPSGKMTIGLGWNLECGCSKPLAELIARFFINEKHEELESQLDFYNDLDEVRKAVLCNMSFNLGVGGVLKFTDTLNAVRKKAYHIASMEMLKSQWAKQVGQRAIRLSKMMDCGLWI